MVQRREADLGLEWRAAANWPPGHELFSLILGAKWFWKSRRSFLKELLPRASSVQKKAL